MGGGDIPASGFALYLDRLMELTKPVILVKQSPQKILVRVESPKFFKTAFEAADLIRKEGYIAELAFDKVGKNYMWIVEIYKKNVFRLINKNGSARDFSSFNGLLNSIIALDRMVGDR
jgi:histidyl-tRNA synthetase